MSKASTSNHHHPAVGDVFRDKIGDARIVSVFKNKQRVWLERDGYPRFSISRPALMASGKWKNQCPICFPPEQDSN